MIKTSFKPMTINISKDELVKRFLVALDTQPNVISGLERCGIIHSIIKDNTSGFTVTKRRLYSMFMNRLFDMNISYSEWNERYGIKGAAEITYDIVSEL